MAGVVVMLLAAGLLEGLGRQLVTGDAARYAIGLAMLVLLVRLFLSAAAGAPMAELALQHRRRGGQAAQPGHARGRRSQPQARRHRPAHRAPSCSICIIMVGILIALHHPRPSPASPALGLASAEIALIVWLLGFFLLRNFYFILMEMGPRAATFGKRMRGPAGGRAQRRAADRRPGDRAQPDARDRILSAALLPLLRRRRRAAPTR